MLSETSMSKTHFTIPNRPSYQLTRSQIMCRLMDIVIPYHTKSHVFVYLDDLLIMSDNFEKHLEFAASRYKISERWISNKRKETFFLYKNVNSLLKFILQCEARTVRVGAVLAQLVDEGK